MGERKRVIEREDKRVDRRTKWERMKEKIRVERVNEGEIVE